MPKELGGYELVDRIAKGGMASLFLARRAGARGFVKPVAVKVIHEHLADDPEIVELFVDEANLCSRLSHPNIVHVEELGEQSGRLYMVMELVDGCPLRWVLRLCRRSRVYLPLELVGYIVSRVADGLHFAHEARDEEGTPMEIVHRDICPTNILLSRVGAVKVIDFGVAKSSTQLHQTALLKLKGKIAYMSPEQIRYRGIDRRSDVYSLGVVLWELLAGRRAFKARDEVELIQKVTQEPLGSVAAYRPQLSPELVQVVETATARNPEDRFPTALAFRAALQKALPQATGIGESDLAPWVVKALEAKGEAIGGAQRARAHGSLPGGARSTGSGTPSWAEGSALRSKAATPSGVEPSQPGRGSRPGAESASQPGSSASHLDRGSQVRSLASPSLSAVPSLRPTREDEVEVTEKTPVSGPRGWGLPMVVAAVLALLILGFGLVWAMSGPRRAPVALGLEAPVSAPEAPSEAPEPAVPAAAHARFEPEPVPVLPPEGDGPEADLDEAELPNPSPARAGARTESGSQTEAQKEAQAELRAEARRARAARRAARRAEARRTSASRTDARRTPASRTDSRATTARAKVPESTEPVSSPKPRSGLVDGVLLATPDDLDHSSLGRAEDEADQPTVVEQDGVGLADDYQ